VSFRLEQSLLDPFIERARSEDRTLSAEIRQALRRDLEREPEPDQAEAVP
jgi:hypothetical protein